MRLLLLQARTEADPAADHEREAFAGVIGVDAGDIRTWDLLRGAPTDADLCSADCVLVGGSGDFSLVNSSGHAWISEFIDTMGRLTTLDVPVFASCFGFQALVVACGGRIVSDKSRAEFGTFEVTLTQDGYTDSLFSEIGSSFPAQFGHADHAAILPSVFVNLASTELNAYQAAKVSGRDIYMTQFHPELSMKANQERARMYLESYAKQGFVNNPEAVRYSFRESREASGLLRRFVRDQLDLD